MASLIHGLLVSALGCNCRGKQHRWQSNLHVLGVENWEPWRAVALVILKTIPHPQVGGILTLRWRGSSQSYHPFLASPEGMRWSTLFFREHTTAISSGFFASCLEKWRMGHSASYLFKASDTRWWPHIYFLSTSVNLAVLRWFISSFAFVT